MKLNNRIAKKNRLEGFSLVEMSIALLIIGIMAGAVLKGTSLIWIARAESVTTDILTLRSSYAAYRNAYGNPPGDDNSAASRFGESVKNGDGDGVLSADDAKNTLLHIHHAGLTKSPNFKIPKTGGQYTIISDSGVPKVMISNNGKGNLSREQALAIVTKLTETIGIDSVETDPKISSESNDTKYLIKVKLE
jgi:prepilin-type N-terminal cleavage/methylation domain-containing protein